MAALGFQRDSLGYQGPVFPLSVKTLALFIPFLAEQKYAASTLFSTYISALSYPHCLASLSDPTKADMIQSALRGVVYQFRCQYLRRLYWPVNTHSQPYITER